MMQLANGMRLAARLAAVLALFVTLAAPALGATLDGGKAAGQIGEGPDGYLHIVDASAPADVKALVSEVNTKRTARYQEIAQKNNAPMDAVAARAGAKLIERAPAGQFVLNADGTWRKK